MSKCLVLFVEGDTEVEFYKQVVANARKLHPAGRFDTNIEYRNVRGVGGFKSIALRKFTKEIKVLTVLKVIMRSYSQSVIIMRKEDLIRHILIKENKSLQLSIL